MTRGAAPHDKPPQSADPLSRPRKSPRSLDVLGPVPRTADVFSRHMTGADGGGGGAMRPPSATRNINSIFRDASERTYNGDADFEDRKSVV